MDFWLLLRTWAKKLVKDISNLMIIFKQPATDALRWTPSKSVIQKTAEATGNLTDNKIPDKITKVWRSSPQNSSETVESETEDIGFNREIPK